MVAGLFGRGRENKNAGGQGANNDTPIKDTPPSLKSAPPPPNKKGGAFSWDGAYNDLLLRFNGDALNPKP